MEKDIKIICYLVASLLVVGLYALVFFLITKEPIIYFGCGLCLGMSVAILLALQSLKQACKETIESTAKIVEDRIWKSKNQK